VIIYAMLTEKNNGKAENGAENGADLFLSLSVDKRDNSRRGMEFNLSIATTGAAGR